MTWTLPGNESELRTKDMTKDMTNLNIVIECRDDQDCVCDECWMNVEWTDNEQIEKLLQELGL